MKKGGMDSKKLT